jgi:hypothetical protein
VSWLSLFPAEVQPGDTWGEVGEVVTITPHETQRLWHVRVHLPHMAEGQTFLFLWPDGAPVRIMRPAAKPSAGVGPLSAGEQLDAAARKP